MKSWQAVAHSAALLVVLASTAGAQVVYRAGVPDRSASDAAPAVDVWLDRSSYERGSVIRPNFATEKGAYVVIARVTTDGGLRILYPERPTEQRRYGVGQQLVDDRVSSAGNDAFRVDESRGTGFVFAVASYDRFDFRAYTTGSVWSLAKLSGSRTDDAFAVIQRFISRTLPTDAEFSLDYITYEVHSTREPSHYATTYLSFGWPDYYDRCVSAFRTRHSLYCRSYYDPYYDPYYGGYYRGYRIGYGQPRVIGRPVQPLSPRDRPAIPKGRRRPGPLVPDPMVPAPALGSPAEVGSAASRAESDWLISRARRAGSQPRVAIPSASPSSLPRIETGPVQRSEPRMEGRPMPRSEPRMEARPILRSEPRLEARPERTPDRQAPMSGRIIQ